jgi:hypothetical protein
MVSPLWTAASEGDLATVTSLLTDDSALDIDIKDQNGSTALLQAARNGHVEVFKALLAKGASVSACPEFAQPEHITTNPEILDLLANAGAHNVLSPIATEENHFTPDGMDKQYYPQMSHAYPYFPTLNGPSVNGAVYYPPSGSPTLAGEDSPNGGYGHYPPPDVARMIPCRYFPACRYGPSCMFAHPQAPYFQSSMPPPAQYPPPFDPRSQPYPQNYYGVPPAPYPPANGMSPMSPMSPASATPHTPTHPGLVHVRSVSEMSPPPQGPPFSPARTHPHPYPSISPMSPPGYPHPGPVPVPMGVPSLPPVPQQAISQGGPQSPSIYPSPGPYPLRPNGINHYPATNGYPEANGIAHTSPSHADGSTRGPAYRDGTSHNRRGSFRRNSFIDKKRPPCIFFPSGKCKNGDDCRFAHVLPDSTPHYYQHQPGYHQGRGSGRRGGFAHANGVSHLTDKMGNMNLRESQAPNNHNRGPSENAFRGRFSGPDNVRHQQTMPNGVKSSEKKSPLKTQRVPQADEFPALAGTSTPRARSPGSTGSVNGSGPTAAQVLQRAAPQRGDSYREPTQNRGSSPEAPPSQLHTDLKPNATASRTTLHTESPSVVPVKSIPSFASIASPSATGPTKELSVTA